MLFIIFFLLAFSKAQNFPKIGIEDPVLTSTSRPTMEVLLVSAVLMIGCGMAIHTPVVFLAGFGLLVVGVFADTCTMGDFLCSFSPPGDITKMKLEDVEKKVTFMKSYFPRSDTEMLMELRDSLEQKYDMDTKNIDFMISSIYWDNWMTSKVNKIKSEIQSKIVWYTEVEMYYMLKNLWLTYDYNTFDYLTSGLDKTERTSFKREEVGDFRAVSNFFHCVVKSGCSLGYKWKHSWYSRLGWMVMMIVGIWFLVSPPSSINRKKTRIIGIVCTCAASCTGLFLAF